MTPAPAVRVSRMLDEIDDPERESLLRSLWQLYRLGRRVAVAYRAYLSLVEGLLSIFAATVLSLVEASVALFTR